MFRIFPHSKSQETGKKIDDLPTHLNIFKCLRIKMSDDSDGDDIAAVQILQKCNIHDLLKLTSLETKFRRLLSIQRKRI